MIRLDKTTRTIMVVMGAAKTTTEPTCAIAFYDENLAGDDTKGALQTSTFNDTTDVTACAAPPQSFVRCIESITVYNADTVAQAVTVKIDDNGTQTRLIKYNLTAGQSLVYENQGGWNVLGPFSTAIAGTTSNDSAAAGNLGEYFSASVSAPGNAATSTVAQNITSISLTAGDWDVSGTFAYNPAPTTTTTSVIAWLSSVSATQPSPPNGGSFLYEQQPLSAGIGLISPVGTSRFSLAATTTVYLSSQITFAVSTAQVYGMLMARRVR